MTSAFAAHDFQIDHLHWRKKVTKADVAAIKAMVQQTGFFNKAEIDIAIELAEDAMKHGRDGHYQFVLADYNGKLAGFACFGQIPATQHRFDLYWIVVHPDWQGCGVGRMLMKQAEMQAKQHGALRFYIETSTRPQYDPSRKFYDRCGYQQIADLKGYYADNDGKAIYMKQFFHTAQTSLNDEADDAA